MPEFFTRATGAVVSFTIDKYIYVSVNKKFDGRTRVSYSRTEIVDELWKLEHDLVRETLGHFKLKGLEITSISDIPGEGSGLGSSSAFTVGLVRALNAYQGGCDDKHPAIFAESAYGIERNLCEHPVGKQDHYAAAFGGLNYFQFNPDGSVNAEKIKLTCDVRNFLENYVMLFWTGKTRSARQILRQQSRRFSLLSGTRRIGETLAKSAGWVRSKLEDEEFREIGEMLNSAWEYKKKLASVSDEEIERIYLRAISAGAQGGKICGAGGGGFMILVADPSVQRAVEEAVGLQRVHFKVEEHGSQVVYKG